MIRRKPKPAKPRFACKPSVWATTRAVFYVLWVAIMQITWPIRILIVAIPVAAYFAYPYYEEWSIWDKEFQTQVYNMNDEAIRLLRSTRYDSRVNIGVAGIHPNSMSDSYPNYTNTREITFEWNFNTRDHGHTEIKRRRDRTCYSKTIELPKRLKGQNVLLIGVYNRDVLRIRWGSNEFIPTDIIDGRYSNSDAWQHDSIPLASNWRKDDPTNWPEKTTWNEAVDGPKIDVLGAGAWLTVKADAAKPCEEHP